MQKIFKILVFLVIFGLLGLFLGTKYVQFGKAEGLNSRIIPASAVVSAPSIAISPSPEKEISEPTVLNISGLGVSASVEKVQQDSEGRMDVPKKAENVGWYSLGVKPGQTGNSVMAGHLDKATGEPAVFFNLNKLVKGDILEVKAENGAIQRFKVVDKKSYPWNEFPLQLVFGDTNKKNLNLITCGGSWDTKSKNYSNRMVVYSELIEN